MGKEQQNMELRYHPEDRAGVTVALHWGRYGIDSTRTIPVERWRAIVERARTDLDGAVGELLSIAGVEAHLGDRRTILDGYGRSLKALLGI